MKEKPSYTLADIERYHSGNLTPAERHALERAALADPFLADALEGYMHTPSAQADVAVLHQRLQVRLSEKQSPRLVWFRQPWLQVAAVLLLLAGGGWLLWRATNGSAVEESVALAPTVLPPAPAATPTDSTATVTAAAEPERADSNKMQGYTASTKSGRKNEPVAGLFPQPSVTPAGQPPANEAMAATAVSDSGAMALQSDSKKADALRGRTDTLRDVNVVMRPADMPMAEVVVPSRKAAVQARRKFTVGADSVEPAQGWEAFDDYIATNMRPTNLSPADGSREVELAFDINPSGRPVNISVRQSQCRPCEEEAIRLLREGPRWKRNKKAGKVMIRFPENRR